MEPYTPDFSVCTRVISSRWMLPILHMIGTPQRFGDIQAVFPGLSRGVLATQLQALLQMELLHQTRYDCFPPRVEYRITKKGRALLEILAALPAETD